MDSYPQVQAQHVYGLGLGLANISGSAGMYLSAQGFTNVLGIFKDPEEDLLLLLEEVA